jgi:succinate dehydrogenase / fumarate reductase flavoprotein subunit
MGGIRVDSNTQETTVPGLFACGECAAGLHGANRLGGNSLSDLIVFGTLAGRGAADYIKKLSSVPVVKDDDVINGIRYATSFLNRETGNNPYLVHDELKDLMQEKVGIVRNEEWLSEAIEELQTLIEKAENVKVDGSSQYNPGWHEALSLKALLITSEVVANAARMRKESRGAHTRFDYESELEEWSKYNIVVRKGKDGRPELEKVERTVVDAELERIARSPIDVLEKEVEAERVKAG